MTTATAKRKPAASRKPAGGSTTITCAFCKGTGSDPYEVLSKLSNCQVCNGCGTVQVETPTVPCAYCRSTGKQRHTRLTCSACGGKGVIHLAGPTVKCPQCNGSGKMHGADLPCSLCKGAGLIARKSNAPKQKNRTASKGRARSKK